MECNYSGYIDGIEDTIELKKIISHEYLCDGLPMFQREN